MGERETEGNSSSSVTHTHAHTQVWFTIFVGTLHRRNDFYSVQTVYSISLHYPYSLNLTYPSQKTFYILRFKKKRKKSIITK